MQQGVAIATLGKVRCQFLPFSIRDGLASCTPIIYRLRPALLMDVDPKEPRLSGHVSLEQIVAIPISKNCDWFGLPQLLTFKSKSAISLPGPGIDVLTL